MNQRAEGDPIAVDITSSDFLDTTILKTEGDLADTKTKISDIQTALSQFDDNKKNINFAKKEGLITSSDAVSQLKQLNQSIRQQKAELDSLQTIEKEQSARVKRTKAERGQRRFDEQFEIANRRVTRF
jgi:septal ring factor EnvC (AmiA/AmiB activator)